jgi:oxygen-independent coproporphyrinogen-3 oxidase
MSGIYIHIPFCKQACHYCDFHFSTSTKYVDRMVGAICKEIRIRKNEVHSQVATIYFGGGTPSVLDTHQILQIIDTVYANYDLVKRPEITLEANPDDLSQEKLEQLAASPVNRLSIGVQSFYEQDLKLMNRAHNAIQAWESIQMAKGLFDNISIDLIYGMPDMSAQRWLDNIKKALELQVPHISSYALTVEDHTALKTFIDKGLIADVDDDMAEQHFQILLDVMQEHDYVNYEFSNFGKPGFYSQNNTAYWTGKKYLGIGPSAHSFNGEQRAWNVKNNVQYMNAIENGKLPQEIELLTKVDRYNEYVMTGLRTIFGVSLDKIEQDYGPEFKDYLLDQAKEYLTDHLLFLDGDTLMVTRKGKFLSDGIASELFMLNLS